MKQIRLLIILALLSIVHMGASAASQIDATDFKALVRSYVQSEGYAASIDSDGDVKFKYQGDTYWVMASPYDDGFYVTILTITNIQGYDINLIRKAMDETMASLKYVRLYTIDDSERTSYSWYCGTMKDFKVMFENVMNVVSTADSRFINKVLEE